MSRPTPRAASEVYVNHDLLIDRFREQHEFLSSFYRAAVRLGDEVYPTAEHAFHALKTDDPEQRRAIRLAPTAAKAKAAGRAATMRVTKAEWDTRVRYEVMDQVVAAKFTDVPLRNALIATRDALLIEGTGTERRAWHDQAWGQCFCDRHRAHAGDNALGRALMAHRDYLRGAYRRWTRVAVTGHRPHLLTDAQSDFARAELDRLAVKLKADHKTKVAISGFAIGADTWWSQAALAADLRLWAYVPFWAQPNRWSPQQAATWEHLLGQAERHLVLGDDYDVRLLHERNAFMVRDANLIVAVHNPQITTGGTVSAIAKARAARRPMVLVDVVARRTTIENPDGR
ncbi:NADAR family protein [Cellulosimicrobium sp. Marseille-Q4280]|uniref:NADAR family protein n=1 Tax=Cellulosimicrobium sp. Marseille-Q4280 TaxID=2937992 RepID=UPI00203C4002|nr:NADAR family protein [Cellulosimicrobium sp. Marseille-Q4280]